jgi:vancomycin aglycone glucosyltransferase
VLQNRRPDQERTKTWGHDVRVLVSTYGGRGDELLVGLAVRLRALGAEVRVCAPPDQAERSAASEVSR